MSTGISLAQQPTYDALHARMERKVTSGQWRVIVAEVDRAVAGFAAIDLTAAVLEQIFVAPDSHQKGIGAKLMAAARQAMPGGFTLWMHGENLGAQAFYAQMGMTLVSQGVHPEQGYPIVTFAFGPVAA